MRVDNIENIDNVNSTINDNSNKNTIAFSDNEINNTNDGVKVKAVNSDNTSTENVPDEIFFNDKRYVSTMEKLKNLNDENKILKEEDKNLKFTIEVFFSCRFF